MTMLGTIIAQAADVAASEASALPEALRISGIGLLAIFCVMGFFGAMIAVLVRLFPDRDDQ